MLGDLYIVEATLNNNGIKSNAGKPYTHGITPISPITLCSYLKLCSAITSYIGGQFFTNNNPKGCLYIIEY
jgi:hypothetical protein